MQKYLLLIPRKMLAIVAVVDIEKIDNNNVKAILQDKTEMHINLLTDTFRHATPADCYRCPVDCFIGFAEKEAIK